MRNSNGLLLLKDHEEDLPGIIIDTIWNVKLEIKIYFL